MFSKKLTPEYKLCERIRRRFRQGVREFDLVKDEDHILIGCSGGKDSLTLIQLIGEMKRYSKVKFTVTAVHIKNENIHYESDISYLQDFSKSFNIDLIIRTISFSADEQKDRTPCFLCSWNRRKALFELAQEIGCNKIALGHHKDDIITTTLMNLSYNGTFSTMPVLLKMRKMPLTIIRPLCMIEEEDIKLWAKYFDYKPLIKLCPFDSHSHRSDMSQLLPQLLEFAPEIKNNIWHALKKEKKLVEI